MAVKKIECLKASVVHSKSYLVKFRNNDYYGRVGGFQTLKGYGHLVLFAEEASSL